MLVLNNGREFFLTTSVYWAPHSPCGGWSCQLKYIAPSLYQLSIVSITPSRLPLLPTSALPKLIVILMLSPM